MGEKEVIESTANELIAFARKRGVDLVPTFQAESFWNDESDRHIIFMWRDGELFYQLAGRVATLPSQLRGSEGPLHFAGAYSESGVVYNLDGAYSLLKSWLLDRREVDDLPARISNKLGKVE